MQQRSSSAGLTLHFLLLVLVIAGINAGLSVQTSAQTPPSASSAEGYILGPNDRIRLKVYGEADITGEYEINIDGRVSIPLAQYRPYYILGEVKKSGEYPYRNGLTVMDAVASAGGFTYRANESKVHLRRAGAGREEILPLDAPVPVFPGDNIRIPERYF
jgi:protein involved in polysaccharide export with SLBB domain